MRAISFGILLVEHPLGEGFAVLADKWPVATLSNPVRNVFRPIFAALTGLRLLGWGRLLRDGLRGLAAVAFAVRGGCELATAGARREVVRVELWRQRLRAVADEGAFFGVGEEGCFFEAGPHLRLRASGTTHRARD